MKLPFALIIGKNLEDIAEEQLGEMTLTEAVNLAFETHDRDGTFGGAYNARVKPIKFDRIYGEIANPLDALKKVKVLGNFEDLPQGLIDTDLDRSVGAPSQNQLVLLDKGVYLQRVSDYANSIKLWQGIAFVDPHTYMFNTEQRKPKEGEIRAGASYGSSCRDNMSNENWVEEYSSLLASRRIYKTVAKELLLNAAELSDRENLIVLCQREELADVAMKL